MVATSLTLGLLAPAFGDSYTDLSEEWRTLLEWNGHGGILDHMRYNLPQDAAERVALMALLVSTLAYVVAVQIGIFLFRPFARVGYVLIAGGFALFAAFDGLYVATPLQSAIHSFALVIDGAIIAASYLQPIASYFDRPHVQQRAV